MDCCNWFCCGKGFDRKKRGKTEPTWRVFSLKELHAATNSFNYDNKLGEGGFGSVYWGQLWDGSQIAVKRLRAWNNKDDVDFTVEIEILARVRQKNLLSVRGFCAEGQERLIVYDYMPNLSLVSHLHGQHATESVLDWTRRMHIAISSALGIAYLHSHATPQIIHGDIRASNILLDSDFQPRVADFGFANLIPEDEQTQAGRKPRANTGYLAPECDTSSKESEKSDVYSFGILVLEIATGKRPIERLSAAKKCAITDWVLPLVQERKFVEVADPRLNVKYVEEELKRVVMVGLVCAQSAPERRPTMLEVVELLRGESKEKLAKLEQDPMFQNSIDDGNDGKERRETGPEVVSEEKTS